MYQILVIDDDPTGAQLLIDLLRLEGHRGYALENWRNPVAGLEAQRPDMVIMDVRLGSHDGLALLRQIRSHPDASVGSIPVLMISAENASARCRAAGASGFVEKPFDTESLFRTIQEIMEVSLSGTRVSQPKN
jgi:CheY-like chemotaxis protein